MFVYRIEMAVSIIEKRMTHRGPYNMTYLDNDVEYWLDRNGIRYCPSFDSKCETSPVPEMDHALMQAIRDAGMDTEHVIYSNKNSIYGFSSPTMLKRWFNQSARQQLHEQGYIICVYEAETVYQGFTQVIFDKSTAKDVKYIFLTDF